MATALGVDLCGQWKNNSCHCSCRTAWVAPTAEVTTASGTHLPCYILEMSLAWGSLFLMSRLDLLVLP